MESKIFRKKSMERVSSPEQLNDYIKVCNPSLWIVLAAVILLLSGAIVWGIFGRLDTTLDTVAVAGDGYVTVYVKAADIGSVRGRNMTINGTVYEITDDMCSDEPAAVNSSFSEYTMHIGNLSQGEWVYSVVMQADMPDGVYEAEIVTESVSPMSFVLN